MTDLPALSEKKIRAALPTELRTLEIFLYDSVDSTNDAAKRYAREAPDGSDALFIAERQTAGRGRYGRSFYSPEKRGVYMSLLLRGGFNMPFTVCTAVAVTRALGGFGVDCGIKWVNDILYGGGKVCGILCEAGVTGSNRWTVAGIGINCADGFPDELRSVAAALPVTVDRDLLIARVVGELYDVTGEPVDKTVAEYRAKTVIFGKNVKCSVNGAEFYGTAADVNSEGNLLVRLTSGEIITVTSGEARVIA